MGLPSPMGPLLRNQEGCAGESSQETTCCGDLKTSILWPRLAQGGQSPQPGASEGALCSPPRAGAALAVTTLCAH